MNLQDGIFGIRKILVDTEYTAEERLKQIQYHLPDENYDYKFYSTKKVLLDCAKESGAKKFKLLATMNSNISIFQWCDKENNFLGMCPPKEAEKFKVIYTINQLPDVIDNAEKWLKFIKEDIRMSGSPYFVSQLHIMSL